MTKEYLQAYLDGYEAALRALKEAALESQKLLRGEKL